MILESIFSCTNLLLTCGSSIYILIKHSYTQYSKFFTHLTCACVSIAMIGSRSLIVLLYKLFIKEYSFDPDMIEIEEERNKERFNILDELLGTLSMTGLIYSLYCCHGYYILGVCVVTSLSIFNVIKLYYMIKQLEEMETSRFYNTLQQTKTISKFNVFNWVIVGGCFAYVVGNNYAIVANYPLLLANWAMVPEGFYQGWTINRAINDYLMATYIMCMTEALRQTSTL
ncbi:uncharacterized protein LOC102654481 [Apis mellifera]|uniref:Uncharacterized protein LOC102654481 n=1 Tax=Apis mellifera TaxID=7460 RepID=A0A7M7GQF5_APIME|nr:uncharacterized protein LOC102654481 [Apis mellifera]|eukprot:XP_006563377.2 uncharacterized protein LOC102654481 [Apis mellifera]